MDLLKEKKEVLYANDGTYKYIGEAPKGASTSSKAWTIIRITIADNTVLTGPEFANWDDYLTHDYN